MRQRTGLIVKKRTANAKPLAGSGEWSTEEQEQAIMLGCKLRDEVFKKLAHLGFKKPPAGVKEEDYARQKYEAAECAIAEMLAGIIEWQLNRKEPQCETNPRT